MNTLAERWMELYGDSDPEDLVTVDMDKPNWRGDPLEFGDWVLEDPAGTAIIYFEVVDAPNTRKANWRMN